MREALTSVWTHDGTATPLWASDPHGVDDVVCGCSGAGTDRLQI
jgi:hypothetical protein